MSSGSGASGKGIVADGRNFLLILADEFARNALGCAGHPVVQTPNLDRLAARGARFSQAYTNSPICVPARAAMHTGRHVHDTGCWASAQPYRGRHESWAHGLRRHGMDAVSAGKLHFRRTQDDNGFAPELRPMHVKNGIGWVSGLLRDPLGDYPATAELAAQVGAMDTGYHAYDRAVADAATEWLEARAASGGPPWALFVSFVSPHYPLAAPAPWFELYADADLPAPKPYAGNWRDHPALAETLRFFDYDRHFDAASRDAAIRGYFGLVSFVDDLIGRVLAALEAGGFAEETTILFTSDHGEMLGDFGLWTKQVMFEGSAGIPVLLAGPGIAPGRTVETPVSLVDVFPTVLDAVGVPAFPGAGPGPLPGRSLLEIAAAPDDPERPVLSEYHDGGSVTGAFMLRRGRWKLVHHEGFAPHLFNLSEDPDEQRDRAAEPEMAEVLASMQAGLRAIVDPAAANARAFADQRARIDELGGADAVRAMPGYDFGHSPPG